MATKKTKSFDFEKNVDQLKQLVEKMEKGNLPLEESLHSFEQGVKLIRDCQQALSKAEQKVQILTQQGNEALQPFKPDEE